MAMPAVCYCCLLLAFLPKDTGYVADVFASAVQISFNLSTVFPASANLTIPLTTLVEPAIKHMVIYTAIRLSFLSHHKLHFLSFLFS